MSKACCSGGMHRPRSTVGGAPCSTVTHTNKTLLGFVHAFSTASTSISSSSNERNKHIDDEDDGIESLPNLSSAMRHRVRTMKSRHDELMNKLRDGGDQTALGKELSSLSGIAVLCEKVTDIHTDKKSLLELLNEMNAENEYDEDSKEMTQEIKSELNQLEMKLQSLSQKIIQSLVPLLDPDNLDDLTSANAVIDIRAGTGGDEACLFASEIMAAYEAIAKAGGGDDEHGGKAWDLEVLSVSRTDLGGVKEASLVVSSRGSSGGGSGCSGYSDDYHSFDSSDASKFEQDTAQLLFQRLGPYGFFQYESGVHRVQRVPINGESCPQTWCIQLNLSTDLPNVHVTVVRCKNANLCRICGRPAIDCR